MIGYFVLKLRKFLTWIVNLGRVTFGGCCGPLKKLFMNHLSAQLGTQSKKVEKGTRIFIIKFGLLTFAALTNFLTRSEPCKYSKCFC